MDWQRQYRVCIVAMKCSHRVANVSDIACDWLPQPGKRLVDCLGGLSPKGWIAQMEEQWYGNPEVSGSIPGPVKFSLPSFQKLAFEKGPP